MLNIFSKVKIIKKDDASSQNDIIAKHLVINGSITSMDAFKYYYITRLSARIYDLRKLGYIINNEDIIHKNQWGHVGTYSKYVLGTIQE